MNETYSEADLHVITPDGRKATVSVTATCDSDPERPIHGHSGRRGVPVVSTATVNRRPGKLIFLPAFVTMLDEIVQKAQSQEGVDVAVRPDVNAENVRRQVEVYARRQGVRVECTVAGDKVQVRRVTNASAR